jgi:hypothetical protein
LSWSFCFKDRLSKTAAGWVCNERFKVADGTLKVELIVIIPCGWWSYQSMLIRAVSYNIWKMVTENAISWCYLGRWLAPFKIRCQIENSLKVDR